MNSRQHGRSSVDMRICLRRHHHRRDGRAWRLTTAGGQRVALRCAALLTHGCPCPSTQRGARTARPSCHRGRLRSVSKRSSRAARNGVCRASSGARPVARRDHSEALALPVAERRTAVDLDVANLAWRIQPDDPLHGRDRGRERRFVLVRVQRQVGEHGVVRVGLEQVRRHRDHHLGRRGGVK